MESEGVYMYSVSHGYRLFSAEFAPAAFRLRRRPLPFTLILLTWPLRLSTEARP